MIVLDIDSLLIEVSADAPAGRNLEYDDTFARMERAAQGRPEQKMGESILPAEPPDWQLVLQLGLEIFNLSKDLRVAIYLTRALVHLDGFDGLKNGLTLVAQLLDTWWETLHPELDPADGLDPAMRINALAALCDWDAMLQPVSLAPLVDVKGIGKFGLRDVQMARGDSPPAGKGSAGDIDMTTISAAFMQYPIQELKQQAERLQIASDRLAQIDTVISRKINQSLAIDFSPLVRILKDARTLVGDYLGKRGEQPEVTSVMNTAAQADDPAPISTAVVSASRVIDSREAAARMMDEISEYFRTHEPSSPVPLLMERAKKLSTLGFMEILRDMAPDGLKQAQNISGLVGDKS